MKIGPNGPVAFMTSCDPLFEIKLSLGPYSPPIQRSGGSLFFISEDMRRGPAKASASWCTLGRVSMKLGVACAQD